MRPVVSLLRYPGGKVSLYPRLREIVRNNKLNGTYVEPYAGGAGAALALLITGQVDRIVINDLDPAIYAVWKAVTTSPDDFAELIRRTDLSIGEWKKQKQIYKEADRSDILGLGFATFYLNRANRSGVLNAGPIGGMQQTGNYKIDARFNKRELLERLRLIALYRNQIVASNLDGRTVIEQYSDKPNTFIYADPPYFHKAGSLYMNYFTQDDHVRLAECLNGRANAHWVLTYDSLPDVASLYSERRRELFSLNYSAHRIEKATEVMVFSDGLTSLPASYQAGHPAGYS